MPTKYDPAILQAFADDLYRKAAFIIWFFASVGLLAGAMIGLLLQQGHFDDGPWFYVVAVFGTLIGAATGKSVSFSYRLQASTGTLPNDD